VASSLKDGAMKAYSMDLRDRVCRDLEQGIKTSAVARKYSVSPAWVRRLKQRRAATGEIAPRQQRHGRVPSWVTHAEAIREAVRQAPDATLDEYRQRFRLPMSRATLARALVVLGLTRKKSRSGRASRIVPT
jgi:transposase